MSLDDKDLERAAAGLHEEWDTPYLWSRIAHAIEAESAPRRPWLRRWPVFAAAAALMLTVILLPPRPPFQPAPDTLLSESSAAVQERVEDAYIRSISHLWKEAEPQLARADSPEASNTAEKLMLLDSEIASVLADARYNRYNAQVRTELTGLYREKQRTLKEFLHDDQTD